MKYSEIVGTLEELVRTPIYVVVGALGGCVVFFSFSEGESRLCILHEDGSFSRLTTRAVADVATNRDVDFLLYTHDASQGRELHDVYWVNAKGEERLLVSTNMRVLSLGYDAKKAAYVASSQKETALYVLEGEREVRKLCPMPPLSFVSDVEGDTIVGWGVFRGDPRSYQLFVANLDGRFEVLTPREGSSNLEPKIVGDKVFFVSDYENLGESYWLYSYSLSSGGFERVEFPGKDIYQYRPVELGLADKKTRLVVAERDCESRLFDDGRLVADMPGSIHGAVRVGDTIYFSHSSLTSPTRVFRVRGGGAPEPVLGNREWRVGETSYVKLKRDVEVPTWVVRSYGAQTPGPTIVYVHGGPWSQVSNSWNTFIAALALSGYHVVAPNFRGSTGYGAAYMFMDVGDPGGGDLGDVGAAADYALQSGLASVVGVLGYSYGGYTVLLALGRQPEKWAFGVAGAAVADWVEMYELADNTFKGFIEMLFAGKNAGLMRDRSPITYVSEVKAPLCIVHSQNDTRTPLKPILRYVEELQANSKSFELHVVPNMGHTIRTDRDAIEIILPALFFLKKLEEDGRLEGKS